MRHLHRAQQAQKLLLIKEVCISTLSVSTTKVRSQIIVILASTTATNLRSNVRTTLSGCSERGAFLSKMFKLLAACPAVASRSPPSLTVAASAVTGPVCSSKEPSALRLCYMTTNYDTQSVRYNGVSQLLSLPSALSISKIYTATTFGHLQLTTKVWRRGVRLHTVQCAPSKNHA
jgi:hypothetical protein